MKTGRAVVLLASTLVAALSTVVYSRYRRDLARSREHASSGSRLVETPCGRIEYAEVGDGLPVLVVHGAGGGFDQALDVAGEIAERGFRLVAPSRFGYLGTPVPADASPEAQADAHACLLDALGIRRAPILGASAGAPSAMQFALRHPERCSALVLLVPIAYPTIIQRRAEGAMPNEGSALMRFLFDTALKSDFLFWLAPKIAPGSISRVLMATPSEVVERASADERARVARIRDDIMPVSARRLGLLNDAAITSSLPRYDLERIAVPTLVISAEDDLFGTFEGARYTVEHTPNALFIGFERGGHLWVGHQQELMSEIAAFLT